MSCRCSIRPRSYSVGEMSGVPFHASASGETVESPNRVHVTGTV